MNPYFKNLKKQYNRRIDCLPFQLFLHFADLEKDDFEKVFSVLTQMLSDTNWCTSDYTKYITNQSKQLIPNFKKDFASKNIKPFYSEYQKTVGLINQFLTPTESEHFIKDNTVLANSFADYFKQAKEKSENRELEEKTDSILKDLNSFYREFPSKAKSLIDLLAELPFQLFLLVAHADKNIDNAERIEFLRIIRDLEWCNSDCTRMFFTSTSYFFNEFLLLYNRGKFKKDVKQVKRTIHFIEKIFVKEESDTIKSDLYRLANEVAKASGGIAGFLAVSKYEKKVIDELSEIFGDLSNAVVPENEETS
ncbi:hypothetical protein KJ966_08625 [bacterium]|nr:hypothetical protein [bacterium]